MELQKHLKKLLAEKNVKITALSKATGVPVQTLHNWISGQPPRNITQLKTVAKYFNVSLDYILFGEIQKSFIDYREEIKAGVFEVVLRQVKSKE